VSIASHGGQTYFITFTDNASRFCWLFLIKSRVEVVDRFKQIEAYFKTQFGIQIKRDPRRRRP
jgi:hypothetical protein